MPRQMREASLAPGAPPPADDLERVAAAGAAGEAILSVSRGAGEVAPIMFAGAAHFLPCVPHSPTDRFMELGYHVFVMATQSPDVDATRPLPHGNVLVLLFLAFALNLTAVLIRGRLRARLLGRT